MITMMRMILAQNGSGFSGGSVVVVVRVVVVVVVEVLVDEEVEVLVVIVVVVVDGGTTTGGGVGGPGTGGGDMTGGWTYSMTLSPTISSDQPTYVTPYLRSTSAIEPQTSRYGLCDTGVE